MQQWKRSCCLCILKDLVSLDTFQHFPVKHRYPLTVRFLPVTKSPPLNAALGSTTPLLLATQALWWPLGSGCVPVLHSCCYLTPGWAFVDLLSVVQPRPSIFTAHAQTIWNPRVFSESSVRQRKGGLTTPPTTGTGAEGHYRHWPVWRWRAAEPGRKPLGGL